MIFSFFLASVFLLAPAAAFFGGIFRRYFRYKSIKKNQTKIDAFNFTANENKISLKLFQQKKSSKIKGFRATLTYTQCGEWRFSEKKLMTAEREM